MVICLCNRVREVFVDLEPHQHLMLRVQIHITVCQMPPTNKMLSLSTLPSLNHQASSIHMHTFVSLQLSVLPN